jgi:hypothetical protein
VKVYAVFNHEKAFDVSIPVTSDWDEILSCMCVYLSAPSPAWVSHLVLVDADGDELSGSISTAAHFWKISCRRNRHYDNIFALHGDKDVFSAVALMREEKIFRSTCRQFKVYGYPSGGTVADIYLPRHTTWEELQRVAADSLSCSASDEIDCFVVVDSNREALSTPIMVMSKFWKFVDRFDDGDVLTLAAYMKSEDALEASGNEESVSADAKFSSVSDVVSVVSDTESVNTGENVNMNVNTTVYE